MTPATTAKYRYVHVNDPGSKLRGQTKSPTTVLMGDEDDYKRCIPEIFMDVPGQVRLGKCQVKLQTHTLQSSPGRCRCRVGIIINISSIMPSRLLTGKGYMLPVSSLHTLALQSPLITPTSRLPSSNSRNYTVIPARGYYLHTYSWHGQEERVVLNQVALESIFKF